MPSHLPVLLNEVLDLLQPERGGVFVDATLGLGGHSEAILERGGEKVQLFGLDQDSDALKLAHDRLGEKLTYHHIPFSQMARIGLPPANGILMDIGVSSMQIDTPERGFSFQVEGDLDMRMDQEDTLTAATILNTWPEIKLANLFFTYGEERLSRRIAREIVAARPLYTTTQLSELIVQAYPPALRHKRPHPATRVFQALRIEVNDELGELERGMEAALSLLAPGGVLVIITFHSLEDRMVKHRFRDAVLEGSFKLLTKKPTLATDDERRDNPRSRSAKLRGIARLV